MDPQQQQRNRKQDEEEEDGLVHIQLTPVTTASAADRPSGQQQQQPVAARLALRSTASGDDQHPVSICNASSDSGLSDVCADVVDELDYCNVLQQQRRKSSSAAADHTSGNGDSGAAPEYIRLRSRDPLLYVNLSFELDDGDQVVVKGTTRG
jgi:hypothetical protein